MKACRLLIRCLPVVALSTILCPTVLGADVPSKAAPAAATTGGTPESRTPEGVWKPIAAILGGARLSKESLDAITLRISGTNYEVTVKGETEPDRGFSTLDTIASPKHMTITSTNGPNRGKTFLAIYEMKDERSLRVCYDLSGADFPKEFKAPKGTQLYLVGYRRQKE